MNNLEWVYRNFEIDRRLPSPIEVCRSRENALPMIIKHLGFTKGAEVGVAEGLYSYKLCKRCPKMELYSIDSWDNYETYGDYIGIQLSAKYAEAKKRLAPFKNNHIIRAFSMDAVKQFEDESLDFVYIDANHSYKNVKEDLREWSKKVKSGGIIAGHDYMDCSSHMIWKLGRKRAYVCDVYAVKNAVNDWVKEQNISPLFVLTKINCRSFFYVT